MKKALIVTSVFGFLGSFEKNNIRILLEKGFEVFCASNGSKELGPFGDIGQLDDLNVTKCQIDFARSPFSKLNLKAYRQLKQLIDEHHFELIHCHTPIGGVLTRLAARKARKSGTKVIYTAHGLHFYRGAPLLNWLIYYPAEKICAHFTDRIITINQEDFARAKRKLKAKGIKYIPGVGIDVDKFRNVEVDRIQKRGELGLPTDAVMLLSVGEVNKNKNHEVIIRALAKLNHPSIHYYIAGMGELKQHLSELIESLNISNQVHLLGYRNDIGELCKTADIFCFPSFREGLGLASLEAMAAGLPLITSNVHGINDYSKNGISGFSCSPSSINDFAAAIDRMVREKELREKMGLHNAEFVEQFDQKIVRQKMKEIYEEVQNCI